jgi:protein gp37
MGKSSIEWTATINADGTVTPGMTWNPVRGCTKVSPGCAKCYAETFAERWRGVAGHPYEQGFDLRLVPEKLAEPLTWKKPRKIFVNSMSDLFQEGVPFEYVDKVFAVMALCPQHVFQVLTKRPERMQEYFSGSGHRQELIGIEAECISGIDRFIHGTDETTGCGDDIFPRWTLPLPNVHLGVSVENQKYANERIPFLLQTPAAVRFISYEPALSAVNFGSMNRIDWIIAGSESGHGARPAELDWYRSVRDQCQATNTAFFFKQHTIGKKTVSLPELDGKQWMEFPR